MKKGKRKKKSAVLRRTEVGRKSEKIDNGSNQQLVLVFPGTITPVSLELHPALPYEEWAPIGYKICRVRDWTNFAIGAWLNRGEQSYGEMYVQAAAETGMPEETLMILKYVDSRVAPERRILEPPLTWSHHREVAKFPPEEQVRWLEKALKKGWSVRELRDALKKESGKEKGEENGDGEGREQKPPTGEACGCCGASPAPMRICAKCATVPVVALETLGVKAAIELLRRKPSKPQATMLQWALEYVREPESFESEEGQAQWQARYEGLRKTVEKFTERKAA